MNNHQNSRRKMLRHGVLFLASIPMIAWKDDARASKANRDDFHYQDHPHEGKRCRDCTEF